MMRRRLAAEFERDRRQMLGGRAHHFVADLGRAGEQQVVERLRAERGAKRRVAVHHRDVIAREGLADQLLEQRRRARRQFGHLDDRAIAGRQRADERPGGEQHRIIPRHDDADHTERLRHDFRARRQQPFVGAAALRFHPALAVPERGVDLFLHEQEFGEQHFLFRAIAEVGVHRVGEGVAIVEHEFAQRFADAWRACPTKDTARASKHGVDRAAALRARRPPPDRSSWMSTP